MLQRALNIKMRKQLDITLESVAKSVSNDHKMFGKLVINIDVYVLQF